MNPTSLIRAIQVAEQYLVRCQEPAASPADGDVHDRELAREVAQEIPIAADAWLREVRPFFEELQQMAQDPEVSDAEFARAVLRARDQIPKLYPKLNAKALAASLERCMGAAMHNGIVDRLNASTSVAQARSPIVINFGDGRRYGLTPAGRDIVVQAMDSTATATPLMERKGNRQALLALGMSASEADEFEACNGVLEGAGDGPDKDKARRRVVALVGEALTRGSVVQAFNANQPRVPAGGSGGGQFAPKDIPDTALQTVESWHTFDGNAIKIHHDLYDGALSKDQVRVAKALAAASEHSKDNAALAYTASNEGGSKLVMTRINRRAEKAKSEVRKLDNAYRALELDQPLQVGDVLTLGNHSSDFSRYQSWSAGREMPVGILDGNKLMDSNKTGLVIEMPGRDLAKNVVLTQKTAVGELLEGEIIAKAFTPHVRVVRKETSPEGFDYYVAQPIKPGHVSAIEPQPRLVQAFSPDQPRIPSGNPGAGQWVHDGETVGQAIERVTKEKFADATKPGSKFTFTKKLGGSTGAIQVKDAEGNLYVSKKGGSKGQIETERDANAAYRAAGIAAPKSAIVKGESNENFLISDWHDGKTLGSMGAVKSETLQQIRDGFAMDAIMGNWDVAGMGNDNILIQPNGKAVRIDNGGSLSYRAQGGKKTAAEWGATVNEFETMRNSSTNPTAAALFSQLTDKQIADQIMALQDKKQAILDAISNPKDKAILAQRFDYAALWAMQNGGAKAAQPAPVAAPEPTPVVAPKPTITTEPTAAKAANGLPQTKWADVSTWPAHNGAAKAAAGKIAMLDKLHKEGNVGMLTSLNYTPGGSGGMNSYTKTALNAHKSILQDLEDKGQITAAQNPYKKGGDEQPKPVASPGDVVKPTDGTTVGSASHKLASELEAKIEAGKIQSSDDIIKATKEWKYANPMAAGIISLQKANEIELKAKAYLDHVNGNAMANDPSATAAAYYKEHLQQKMDAGKINTETELNQAVLYWKENFQTTDAKMTDEHSGAVLKEMQAKVKEKETAAQAQAAKDAPAAKAFDPETSGLANPAGKYVSAANQKAIDKIVGIWEASKSGKVEDLLAIKTNPQSEQTYAKKAHQLKMGLLFAMGASPEQLAAAGGGTVPEGAKPAGTTAAPKPIAGTKKPVVFTDADIPAVPKFESSNAANVAKNKADIETIKQHALKGEWDKVKAFTSPSPKVQQWQSELVSKWEEKNQPEPTYTTLGANDVAAQFPPKSVKDHGDKIAGWLYLGNHGAVKPPAQTHEFSDTDKKDHKDHWSTLGDTAKKLIQQYTSNAGFSMNDRFRNGNPTANDIAAAKAAVSSSLELKPGLTTTRLMSIGSGISDADMEKLVKSGPGAIIQEPAFTSTSLTGNWWGNIRMKITMGPGVKGIWLGYKGGSHYSGENELLLPPGTRYQVTKIKKNMGGSKYYMEVLALPTVPSQIK